MCTLCGGNKINYNLINFPGMKESTFDRQTGRHTHIFFLSLIETLGKKGEARKGVCMCVRERERG